MGRPPREVADWIGRWSPSRREQVERLAGMVRAICPEAAEAIKWGRLTFALRGDWHHWLCAVNVTAQEVDLLFHKGSLLRDPAGLLRGTGRYLRRVPHQAAVASPEAVTALLRQAVARRTDTLPPHG